MIYRDRSKRYFVMKDSFANCIRRDTRAGMFKLKHESLGAHILSPKIRQVARESCENTIVSTYHATNSSLINRKTDVAMVSSASDGQAIG